MTDQNSEAVDESIFSTAPYRLSWEAVIAAPVAEVFNAVAAHPESWHRWYPMVGKDCRYTTPPPHGVGSQRYITSFGSPTLRPPIAYPSNPMDTVSSADFARSSSNTPPCTIPNCARRENGTFWERGSGLPFRSRKRSRQRRAQRAVNWRDRSMRSGADDDGGHSSRTIAMSEPRLS